MRAGIAEGPEECYNAEREMREDGDKEEKIISVPQNINGSVVDKGK